MGSLPIGSVESFAVDRGGFLVRTVVPARGTPYTHRCSLAILTAVSQEADAVGEAGFTGEEMMWRLRLPCTQVATAVAFLKERGCIEVCWRRNFAPRRGDVFLDSMIEYHALREEPSELNLPDTPQGGSRPLCSSESKGGLMDAHQSHTSA